MKVLIINKYWYPRGGADVYALWLARELTERGYEVCVFSVESDRNRECFYSHEFISEVETERMSVLAAPRTIGRMFWSFEARRKLRAFLVKEKPDVVHLHNIYSQMSPSILGILRDFGVPTVMTVHDYGVISANYSLFDDSGIDIKGSFLSVVRRRGVKRSYIASFIVACVSLFHRTIHVYEKGIDKMIFTTEFVRGLFAAHGWIGDTGTVLPYVVSLEGEDLNGYADDGYLFFAGRLHKTKGVHILIEAALKSGVPLKIAGDGPDMAELRMQAGAATNIEFLGSIPRRDVLSLMRRARAVVVPSVWLEPFGLVALEPQGLRTAVIASKIGGLGEVLVDGQTGFYVEPEDIDGLARVMRRIYEDPGLARKMGEMGRLRYEAVYDVDVHMEKLKNIYDEVIK